MDKYQKYLLSFYGGQLYEIFYRAYPIEQEKQGSSIQYVFSNEKEDNITIIQDEDITKTKYVLIIRGKENYKEVFFGISVYANKKWEEIKKEENRFRIIVDFNNRIEKIKLSFVNNLADDYIFNVKYQEADKEKYFAKKEQEKKELLLKTANIKIATGIDLVNIYFQPCCDNYDRTEIVLYKDNLMLAKYKVNEEEFFKSINGLAFGKYEIVLKQFDKNGAVLLETDKIPFSIYAPDYGGKPTVII